MSLEQVLKQYAEWRVVVETYDQLVQDLASIQISLEKLLPKETSSIAETHLEHQHKTMQNLLSYVNEELETDISQLREQSRNVKTTLDIYNNTLDELSTMKQAFALLTSSGHFDSEEAEFSKAEYDEEIARLTKNVENAYKYLISLVGVKE